MLNSCVKKDGEPSRIYIENRNSGLIGEQITDYYISPTDSNVWLLQCTNRAYITTDKGLNWAIVDAPDNCYQFKFGRKGDIICNDSESFYIRTTQNTRWDKIIVPDSVNFVTMLQTAPDSLLFILKKTQNAKSAYMFSDLVFSAPPQKMNKSVLDSLYNLASFHRMQKFLDSTFINLNSGHLLHLEYNTASKRMNGVHRPEIITILQDELQPNQVSAIQVFRNNTLVNQYYWFYISADFGKNWLLKDSASDYRQLLPLSANELRSEGMDRKQNRLRINDTLYLTTSYEKGGLILNNSNSKVKKILLSTDSELFNDVPNFINTSFNFKTSQFVFKADQETLKILFASQAGGIKYLEVKMDNLQNIEK